jgi:hypothetical protein
MNRDRGDDRGGLSRAVTIRGKSSLAVFVLLHLRTFLTRIVEFEDRASLVGFLNSRGRGGVDFAAQNGQPETSSSSANARFLIKLVENDREILLLFVRYDLKAEKTHRLCQ